MRVRLLVISGARPTRITLKLPTIIGRGAEARLKVRQALISRKHCHLFARGDTVWVEDLGSSNGTFLNGERCLNAHACAHGDNLRVGNLVFRLEVELSPQSELVPEIPATVPSLAVDVCSEVLELGTEPVDDGPKDHLLEADGLPAFLRYQEIAGGSFVGIEHSRVAPEVVNGSLHLAIPGDTRAAVTDPIKIDTGASGEDAEGGRNAGDTEELEAFLRQLASPLR